MKTSHVLGACLALGAAVPAQAQESYEVIVHSSVPGAQIEKETLQAIFLRQTTHWGDGTPIRVVDQSARSPVRAAFSKEALGQSVVAITTYWSRQIVSGKGHPPPVKASDVEVIAWVKSNAGAIAYVTAGAAANEPGVRVLKVIE